MFGVKNITEAGDLQGKKILLRTDFNVPVKDGQVTEDFRIAKALPTIEFLQDKGAKIVLLSHLQDKEKNNLSLKPVAEHLRKYFPISFAENFEGLESKLSSLKDGEVVLFENIRLHSGEKVNDLEFAQKLSSFGDIYVNNAFSVSHRKHASIVGLPKFLPGFVGFLFEKEVKNLSEAFSPEHQFLFILGGAKTETKLPLLEKFSKSADSIFVGGILANDFLKAKGLEVGQSKVSEIQQDFSRLLKDPKMVLPEKVLVTDEQGEKKIKSVESLEKGDSIKDLAVENFAKLEEIISQAKFILWNGPMGNLEEGFTEGTRDLAYLISRSKAEAILGGGDSISALGHEVLESFSFVSTGGGAMLDFLAHETLPGIEALKN